ncbi:hypothetical protein Dsin_029679 [Dipteronia sinensis]|uniref:chlorophyllase n=1 Tax=Dipteronia sinensis TaxID=43782 RepID=A0AAE0DVD8_9ROSI|nr:hypothetical protein Dsin_029679 [Dipteronia sinensis]
MSPSTAISSSASVFETAGRYTTTLQRVESAAGTTCNNCCSSSVAVVPALPPPKPLLIATPCEAGEFPLLIFLHGYLLHNSFYSQLLQHVASHGFIVIAPQLYEVAGADSTGEIKSAAATTNWLSEGGLRDVLPPNVHPNLSKLGLAGHSRGGKTAFALALTKAATTLKFSALIGIDPVDGMDKGKQTPPPVLTYVPRSFDLDDMAVMVIGSGLGEVRRNPLFPPCAPKGVNHGDFFNECRKPACHFVVKDYGHLDMLDNDTKGIRGKATYCLCKNGESREPMRRFVGGIVVAFMKAYLDGDASELMSIRYGHETAPVELQTVEFLE